MIMVSVNADFIINLLYKHFNVTVLKKKKENHFDAQFLSLG